MVKNNPILHIASRIFNTPLLITTSKLDTIMAVLADRLGVEAPIVSGSPVDIPEQRGASTLQLSGPKPGGRSVKMGVIPVYGTLVHRASGLDALSGLRSYEAIRRDFRASRENDELEAIIFDFATPGGEGHGCFDLAEEIFQARGQGKKIIGIANEYAYSAGYGLLSSCEEVYLTRTAGVGSIGVIARHLDKSAKDEKEGLKYTTMFVGDRKNDFSQDEPLSDMAKQILREELVTTYDLFVDLVARNMDMKTSAVRDTQAAFYTGAKAVEAGLAHEVLSFEQAVGRIAENLTTTTGGRFMSTQKTGLQHQLEALFKGSSDEEIKTTLCSLGYVPAAQADMDKVREEARKEGYQEALDYAQEIHGLCALGGMPKLAANLIADHTTIENARKKIIDARAEEDERTQIGSAVSPGTTGAISPLVADAQARADKK